MKNEPLPLIMPPALPPGGRIGLVAPGRWPLPEELDAAKAFLEARGFSVLIHPQCYERMGQMAGPDAHRAEAIQDMFGDPAIDVVMCARGGTGVIRLLDLLDYDIIRKNPKPFVGFSDITALHHALRAKTGLVTFHGPIGFSFSLKEEDAVRSWTDLWAVIGLSSSPVRRLTFEGLPALRTGVAEGTLMGGSLSLLQPLVATPYDWSAKGAILFIEDVDEQLYRIDRMLAHLRLAGRLKDVSAVLVGEMVKIPDGNPAAKGAGACPYGRTMTEIITDNFPADIPMVMNVPCGHGPFITTFPQGTSARLEITPQKMELSFPSCV